MTIAGAVRQASMIKAFGTWLPPCRQCTDGAAAGMRASFSHLAMQLVTSAASPLLSSAVEISGARVVVVGGASGMARATAERIAAGGGTVAILDRPGTQGGAVADAIGGVFLECDITDFEGTAAALHGAIEALGGLDVG